MPKPISIQIVGVDEANVKDKKLAFTAPIARALIGKKVGKTTTFQLGNEEKKLTIKNIAYVE